MQPYVDPWRLEPRPGAISLRFVRDLFVRGLGLVHLMAFVSLWVQIQGLVGSNGILPAVDVAAVVRARMGWTAIYKAPSLFWLWPSDAMLHLSCAAGVVLAIGVMAGFAQGPLLLGLWALYLSVYYAGQEFLAFQWDLLLLEATFLALFVAPWRIGAKDAPEPAPLAMTLLRLLTFKLMFLSGFVKLASGDPSWWGFTALTFHWWTQPLPNPVAWYVDRLPLAFQKISVATTFAIELLVPWLVFGGRRARFVFAGATVFLMVLLGLSGNYGFFQPLTIVLALTLLDDGVFARWLKREPVVPEAPAPPARAYVVGTAATVLLLVNLFTLDAAFRGPERIAAWESRTLTRVWPFRVSSTYGLFARMTKTRPEVVVEGSLDGETWVAYEFRWKPGALDRAPPIVAPHMPRLDWMMWFAGIYGCDRSEWFEPFVDGLLAASPAVIALLADNPFPDEPPREIRTTIYRYTFADPGTEDWWKREGPVAEFCPTRRRP